MAGKTVIFNDFQFNERGTSVSMFHFARYNEEILGNTSLILVPQTADKFSLELFEKHFQNIQSYASIPELNRIAKGADLLYMQTSGLRAALAGAIDIDDVPCRTGIHAVFTAHDPHGDVYAAISPWIAEHYALLDVPVVPLIADLPDVNTDLRSELGIPDAAVVFGRHGGYNGFNILPVLEVVAQAVRKREDLYFLFLNTAPFFDHPRIIHLPKTHDMEYKTRFINTCDAMLHARREGETFGLSVAEFSIRKKPILTWFWSHDRHHLNTLGSSAMTYRTPRELFQMLTQFKKGTSGKDCYSELYNPDRVMKQFETVFLG